MREKKNAINISILMILCSLLIIFLCWCKRNEGATELLYVLATGVFGSSFATLWIFIYEYRKARRELLTAIFNEITSIFENAPFYWLERFGFYAPGVKEYMKGKHYIPPAPADAVKRMSTQERGLYMLCRFVDEALDIGYDRIKHILDLVEDVDFWSDSFRRNAKYKGAISYSISYPLYDVFVTAPAMEDGYIFRYFKGFKTEYSYSADEIYPFVCNLDRAMHNTDDEVRFDWQTHNSNLGLHLHEKMWIFRDAFFSPELPRKYRREAMQAFLNNTLYPRVR